MSYILDHWLRWTHDNVCDIETPVNRCSWQPFEDLVRFCVLLTCLHNKTWPSAHICAIFHHLTILQRGSTWMTQRFCHRNCSQSRRHQRLSNFHPGLGQKLGVYWWRVQLEMPFFRLLGHLLSNWYVSKMRQNKCFPKSPSGFRIFFVWCDATSMTGRVFLVKLKIRHLFVHRNFYFALAYCHFEVRWSTRIQWDPVKMLGSEELNLGWALPENDWRFLVFFLAPVATPTWWWVMTCDSSPLHQQERNDLQRTIKISCSSMLLVIHLHLLRIVCFVCV